MLLWSKVTLCNDQMLHFLWFVVVLTKNSIKDQLFSRKFGNLTQSVVFYLFEGWGSLSCIGGYQAVTR